MLRAFAILLKQIGIYGVDTATGSNLMIEHDGCVVDRRGLREVFLVTWVFGAIRFSADKLNRVSLSGI